uniref:Serine/threonineprotein phosphatase 4 regulatory subunit putative n=1 Tax=Albugo laibachii Nc14 TaxID=890382 RepID=F0WHW4_9STRA|nr:serine/threonineprotein phosphatase 4 regulatory subunit putative [Albugo laibachii Nc14]|eukprot:CCA20840.1 serine/threonineprotein phosphatase 4 regulatory subunit putative [Albugo laibachii Nc14]
MHDRQIIHSHSEAILMEMESLDFEGLPDVDIDNLNEIAVSIRSRLHNPVVRNEVVQTVLQENGAYITRILDLVDFCEAEPNLLQFHALFDVVYALVGLCDRSVIEILLQGDNFFSLVEILGYNPGLLAPINFRTELEEQMCFKQVISIDNEAIQDCVHMNFRIYVIKENLLVRMLPDNVVSLLTQMKVENNCKILAFLAEDQQYWQKLLEVLEEVAQRVDGLKTLREIIMLQQLIGTMDMQLHQQNGNRGGTFIGLTLLSDLFVGGALFNIFGSILGSRIRSLDGKEEIELVVEILHMIVAYEGPERLRTHLATEGNCQISPKTSNDLLEWTPGCSLFTALLVVFEHVEPTRSQMFTILKEVFRVSLGQDDKFLNVLYPNYINWLLQPLKYCLVNTSEDTMFGLAENIMELLTFCTQNHGYRIKYLFGRQPVAMYVRQMLHSKNKLCVIRTLPICCTLSFKLISAIEEGVKFVKACVVRAEAFFSRFLIMNELLAPVCTLLRSSKPATAITSAVLDLLYQSRNLSSLVEHIYKHLYEKYKDVSPLVFETIRIRYDDLYGTEEVLESESTKQMGAIRLLSQEQPADKESLEEDSFWEKESDDDAQENGSHDTQLHNTISSAFSQPDNTTVKSPKLVDYEEEDEAPSHSLKEVDASASTGTESSTPNQQAHAKQKEATDEGTNQTEVGEELILPIRSSQDENESETFLGNKIISDAPMRRKSPKVKSLFRTISWKSSTSNLKDDVQKVDTIKNTPMRAGSLQHDMEEQNPALSDDAVSEASAGLDREVDSLDSLATDSSIARKRSFDENARSFIAKKSKPCASTDPS